MRNDNNTSGHFIGVSYTTNEELMMKRAKNLARRFMLRFFAEDIRYVPSTPEQIHGLKYYSEQ